MKVLKFLGLGLLVLCLCVCCLVACDDADQSGDVENFEGVSFDNATVHYNGEVHTITVSGDLPEGTTVTYANNAATEEGVYNATATLSKGDSTKTLSATLTVKEPTPEQVVLARQNTVNQDKNYFDYRYTLEGQFAVLGLEGAVEGIYTGQYREDKATGDLVFKRTTEGELLVDSVKYVYSKGNQLITLKMNEEGGIKKIYVETVDEQGETFVHKPIEQFVNNISKEEIEKIIISSDIPGYKYKAELKMTSQNPYLQKLLDAISGLGSTISLKGVEIPNLANGIQLYFNYGKGGYIEEFFVSVNVTVPIKTAKVGVTLSYEQQGATEDLQIPQDSSFIVDDDDVSTKVREFNDTMLALKAGDSYSFDVEASNNFDPSWKVAATVDKYVARLYKNTKDDEVYFNHSYEYKAHHETDGAETYKYTLGNVIGDDAGVYLVSRKGKNTVSAVEETYTADTQFDYLSSMAIIDATYVDCIKVIENDGEVTYKIYLNKQAAIDIQQKIIDLINSNEAEGVVDVNNYFNSEEYTFEEAVIEVKFKNDELVSVKCETEIRYTPIGGDYTEYNVTLKNTIDIIVNRELEAAQEYVAPSSTGTIAGIGASKYYVLG